MQNKRSSVCGGWDGKSWTPFGCGCRQILNFTLHFCWTLTDQLNMKRIRDSSHPVCLSSSKSIIIFAYLNLLLTLIFRHNKWGCCLLKDGFHVLRNLMQKNHWITLLLWYTLHWMESCSCAPVVTAAYRNRKMCCCAGCLLLFRKLHQVSKNICFSCWFLCSHLGRCSIIAPTR